MCLFNPFNIPIVTDTCVCEPSTKLKNSRYGMFMQVAANPCNGNSMGIKNPYEHRLMTILQSFWHVKKNHKVV